MTRFFLTAIAGLVMSACAAGPSDPESPGRELPQTLQVTCPASQVAESLSGAAIPVSFPAPVTFGGVQPVTVVCSPVSGSSYAVGTTAVNCTASDAGPHTASCGLIVTVTRPGLLTATKFLAFGDSMTEGALPACSPATSGLSLQAFLLRDAQVIRSAVNVPTSYPSVLKTLLSTRYAAQAPVVTNAGLSGERVSDVTWGTNDVTIGRLRTELAAASFPQVVFLLEGVNDLNSNLLHPEVTVPAVVKGLRDLAREARQRGALQVFVATLLPQQANACRGYSSSQISSANDQIRTMVAGDGHVLVDLYAAFNGVADPYIGVDGLHPNQLGYQKIAQTFFDTIRARLETPR